MRSIRDYLLTRLLAGAALLLAGTAVAAYLVLARSIEDQFDDNLADRIQGMASILFQVEDDVEFSFSDELMPEYDRAELPAYFELWFEDGLLLERSNTLAGGDLDVPGDVGDEVVFWSAPLPDGRVGRYAAQRVEVHHVYPEEGPNRPEAKRVLIALARGREEVLAAERTVLIDCAAAFLVLMGLIAVVVWSAVKRGLAPARRLALALDGIQVENLPAHLEVGAMPRELEPMAETADALIRRVDKALERERRTTADIAHELRTPISEVLTVSEVALRNGQDRESSRRALGTVRDVAWRMARTLSTLLKLARLEMGAEPVERADVDLAAIVDAELRSLAAVGRVRGTRTRNLLRPGDTVDSDADVLRIVLSNLLGNALFYAPEGSEVECRLERPDGGWRLVVENGAGDLRPEDLQALSEPFWRKDGARSDRSRSGLGLALSCALAARTGLALEFELEGDLFRACLGRAGGPPARTPAAAGASAPRA